MDESSYRTLEVRGPLLKARWFSFPFHKLGIFQLASYKGRLQRRHLVVDNVRTGILYRAVAIVK